VTTFTVLGCDGSYAGPGGACSGYLLRTATTALWLDTGPGTLGRLQLAVDPSQLTGVVVSHQHPDHFGELPVFYNACKWYLSLRDVPVVTTAGVKEMTETVVGNDLSDVFRWMVVGDGDRVRLGDVDVTFSRTDHPVETLAMRLDTADGSVVYTADTGPGWSPTALGDPVDLLVSEATLPPEYENAAPHLSARQAGQRAAASGAARLAITHLTPGVDPDPYVLAAAAAFGGPVDLATDGATFEVRRAG
jgi:ribonuclease BN (tRNA processing enzyme)